MHTEAMLRARPAPAGLRGVSAAALLKVAILILCVSGAITGAVASAGPMAERAKARPYRPGDLPGRPPSEDPCAQINAQIGALPATGGVLDETGFSGPQTCNATLTIPVPVTLAFGYSAWTFNGNPGIHITVYGPVSLVGASPQYNYEPTNPQGTAFISGNSAAPLILDDTSTGSKFVNLELDGNNTGEFGYLTVGAVGGSWSNVHPHDFRYEGILSLGGVNTFNGLLVNNNGGDGIVFTNDCVMDGNNQIARNGGIGVHTLLGGARLTDVDSDHNGLHGVFFDGRTPPDWSGNQTYVVSTLIKPLDNNPGGFYFLSVNVNGTSSYTPPPWGQYQQVYKMVPDGTVVWMNVGPFPYNLPPGSMIDNKIIGGTIDDNGVGEPSGFVSDNIRIEGGSPENYSANWNLIQGTNVQQAQETAYAVTGIHLLNSQNTTVSGVSWLGGAWGDTNSGDAGGFVIENSYMDQVDASNSNLSSRNPIRIIASTYTAVQTFSASETGSSTSAQSDSYCISVDGRSDHSSLGDVKCVSSTGYGRGIDNDGTNTSINGYVNTTSATPAEHLGSLSSYVDAQGNASFSTLTTPSASITNLQASSASITDLQVGQISDGLSANVSTDGAPILSGDCESHDASIPGVTSDSGVTWAFVGSSGNGWNHVTVRATVATDEVTVDLCNQSQSTVTPDAAKINVKVIN
jgi:hypothetical protein